MEKKRQPGRARKVCFLNIILRPSTKVSPGPACALALKPGFRGQKISRVFSPERFATAKEANILELRTMGDFDREADGTRVFNQQCGCYWFTNFLVSRTARIPVLQGRSSVR